jgi:UPF0176 protein
MSLKIAALYCFAPFDDPAAVRAALRPPCEQGGVRGTLLFAPEGINGTISGSDAAIDAVVAHIRGLPGCDRLSVKFARAQEHPFERLKLRLKREIVTLGVPGLDPASNAGTRVSPADWNALVDDPDTVLIDTRNAYEVAIGSFAGAIDPGTRSFGEFPDWWREHGAEFAGKRIAMFCTGGIRCEKSTAYLKAQGVQDVLHLDGGILAYLEQVPAEESRWQGECFVFDERVSVAHGLDPGQWRVEGDNRLVEDPR